MIYKYSIILIVCICLSGCAGSQEYGNFLTQQIEPNKIVDNAILQLEEHYPPAKTQLYIVCPPSADMFGLDLISKLRASGYEVYEHQPNTTKPKGALDFHYIIDNPQGSTPFVRLTLFIENDVMSCGYDDKTLQPISVWSKGEV